MDHSLIARISAILFEPVAAVAFCGVVLAVLLNVRKRGAFFSLLAFSLCFAVVWRSCITLISNRYAEIFLYAGFAFSAYFIFKFPNWCALVLRRFRLSGRVRIADFLARHSRAVSRILLLILVLICFGKLARYNRYDYGYAESALTVRRDAMTQGAAVLHTFSGDAPRLRYYSGLRVVPHDIDRTTPTRKELRSALRDRTLTVYVVCDEIPGASFTADDAGVDADDWERIYSFPHDNRKKLYLNVYRCRKSEERSNP